TVRSASGEPVSRSSQSSSIAHLPILDLPTAITDHYRRLTSLARRTVSGAATACRRDGSATGLSSRGPTTRPPGRAALEVSVGLRRGPWRGLTFRSAGIAGAGFEPSTFGL